MTDDELLPLPKPTMYFGHSTTFPMYGAEEMRDYARAAIAAERERIIGLLDGIDRYEMDAPDGWWETSTDAWFGAGVLAKIQSGEAK